MSSSFFSLYRSLACAAVVPLCLAAAPLAAQPYTYTINRNQNATVTLPAGGGTALVASGVTVLPAAGNGITGQNGDVWSVTNEGSVAAIGSSTAIALQAPAGTVINRGSISASTGISNNSGLLTVDNQAGGAVSASSVAISSGGTFDITNNGQITSSGSYGVNASISNNLNASLTNAGLIQGTGASTIAINSSTGSSSSTEFNLTNLSGGQILGGSNACAISSLHGTTIIQNDAGATINANSGVCTTDLFSVFVVTNSGQIAGNNTAAVFTYGGGEVYNHATISGSAGVAFVRAIFYEPNTVVNTGTITGTGTTMTLGTGATAGSGAGIYIGGSPAAFPATIDNQSGGTITGGAYGIYIGNGNDDAGTNIRNAGTINAGSSGIAILFSQSTTKTLVNSLTLDTGSILNGNVAGGIGPGTDTLILNGAGSENASKFTNFENLTVDTTPGSSAPSWTLSGNSSFTVASAINTGVLRITGQITTPAMILASGGTLAGNGTIIGNTSNNGTVAPGNGATAGTFNTLRLQGDYAGNGALSLRSQLGGDASPTDVLVISGAVSGTTAVTVSNLGGSGAATTSGILVIDTPAGSPANAFALTGGSVTAGNYRYTLDQAANGKWYLNAVYAPPPPSAAAAVPTDTPLLLTGMALLLAALAWRAQQQSRHPVK